MALVAEAGRCPPNIKAVADQSTVPAQNKPKQMETRVAKRAADEPEARGAASLLGLELADEPVDVPLVVPLPEGVGVLVVRSLRPGSAQIDPLVTSRNEAWLWEGK